MIDTKFEVAAEMKKLLKQSLREIGVDVRRFDAAAAPLDQDDCRNKIMRYHRITAVVDVGANAGQYATGLRRSGFTGRIVSYEPLSAAFAELERRSANDVGWEANNLAIGSQKGFAEINVSKNSFSSSLLPMLGAHVQSAPESRYCGQERVEVNTLDAVLRLGVGDSVLLKIDTQGYERQVLEGAVETLKNVLLIECELSIVPLYAGQELFLPMLRFFDTIGFMPISFHRGFSDLETGHALQVDGIFCRADWTQR